MSEEIQIPIIKRNRMNSISYSSQNEGLLNSPVIQSQKNGSNSFSNSSNFLCPPELKPRKHSLPLINPNQISPNQYLESYSREESKSFQSTILESLDLSLQKHRLSQVGIAVSQHLSSTIGLRLISSHKKIVKQSKCLCLRFIRYKLQKRGLPHKRLTLQKLKSLSNIRVDSTTSLVANQLKCLITELERSHPKLFSSVVHNLNSLSIKSVNEIQSILQIMSQELFRNDITWARIAALFAITCALAVDSVEMGRPDYILPIIDTFTSFVDNDIAGWIAQQGGWDSLIYRFGISDDFSKTLKYWLISLSVVFWALITYLFI